MEEKEIRQVNKCEHLICKDQTYNGELHYVCQDCRETQRVTHKDGSVTIN